MMDGTNDFGLGPRPQEGGTPDPSANFGLGPRPQDTIVPFDPASGAMDAAIPAIGRVLSAATSAFGSGISEDEFSQPVAEELRKANIIGPKAGSGNIIQQFNETILHPLIMAGELAARVGTAGYAAYQASVVQLGTATGQEQLARDVASMPEAYFGLGHSAVMSKAAELKLFGDQAAKDAAAANANRGYRSAPEGQAEPLPPAPPPAPPLDVHGVARQIDPDTFQVFDALSQRKDMLRQQLDDLAEQRGPVPPTPEIKALSDKEDAILAKVNGVESRLTKKQQAALADVRQQLADTPTPNVDTPEMADLRQQLLNTDYQMRDLAEPVTKAYDAAREQMAAQDEAARQAAVQKAALQNIPDTAFDPDTTNRIKQVLENTNDSALLRNLSLPPSEIEALQKAGLADADGKMNQAQFAAMLAEQNRRAEIALQDGANRQAEPPPSAPILSSKGKVISTPDMFNNIVAAEKTKLVKAGRPEDEANLAAQLQAFHYQTMAKYFDGDKGTAEELYQREAPTVEGTKENRGSAASAAKTPKTITTEDLDKSDLFQQVKTVVQGRLRAFNDAKATIKLFRSADVSTFFHETGHKWLMELISAAEDSAAPQALKDLAKQTMDWLSTQEHYTNNRRKGWQKGEKIGDVKSAADITEAHHEVFARAFERYLYDGQAPTLALVQAFAKFREWLGELKDKIQGLTPISDDIKHVFDKLITPEPNRQAVGKIEPRGKALADIHETDAATTPPKHAEAVGDMVEQEIHKMVEGHQNLKEAVNGRLDDTARVGTADELGSEGGAGGRDGDAASTVGSRDADAGGKGTDATSAKVGGGAANAAKEGEGSGGSGEADGAGAAGIKVKDVEAKTDGVNTTDAQKDFEGSTSKFVDKAGNIVLKNLAEPEDVLQAIRDAAAENGGFMGARRGVLSLGEQMDLKDALGMDHIDAWKIGQTFNAEEILKAREALILSAQTVRDAMQTAADSGNAADIAAFAKARAKHIMIQEVVSGVTAEAGRALAAFRNIEGFRDAQELSKFLADTQNLDLFQMQELAERGQSLRNAQQIGKFLDDTNKATKEGFKPSFRDKIIFYYVNSLISGPFTHTRYAVGNAINALVTPLVEIPLAATQGAVREALGMDVKDRVYFGEAVAQLLALGKGSRDGLIAGIEALKTGQSPLLPGERVRANAMGGGKNPLGDGPVATVVGYPGRVVSAIHSLFKCIRYEQNIAGLAYRAATSEGLTGAAFDRRVADATIKAATADALKELYMAPTEYNSNYSHLEKFVNGNIFAKLTIPFLKIGTQITKNAVLERTPAGLFAKDTRDRLLGQGADADMQRAKVILGTALMGATSLMVLEGKATGDGPANGDERAVWLLSHKPNTITIGNLTLPYQGLGSLGMLMRFSANITSTAAGWDPDQGKLMAVEFFRDMTTSFLDESFMRGLHDMLTAVYDQQGDKAARFIRTFATNWIPYSVNLGQVARAIDPYQRQVTDHGMENAFGILDEAQAKIPWLSEGLMPKRDVYGEPISGDISKYRDDPTTQALDALGVGISRVPRNILGVELTDEQHDDFSRISGRYTKELLDDLIASPDFKTLKPATKLAIVDKTIGAARKGARGAIMAQYPSILEQAVDDAESDIEN